MALNPGKNIRLFQNNLLEKLTYVHPIVPFAVWMPVVLYCLGIGLHTQAITIASTALFFVLGFLFWTPSEYILHRWIFHFNARSPFQKRIAFLIHGIHHDDPNDQRRLLMPPTAAILIAVVFYALFALVLGPVLVKPFFAGFILGYLVYDYTHFAVHYMRPKSRVYKLLRKNHMLHHFSTPDLRYGVSTTLWDYVFGTRKY